MRFERGDRLIDWQQGKTFYAARQGTQLGYALIWYTPLPTFRHLPVFFPLERTLAKAFLIRFKSSPE
ncbi:MAG: hypothetical protein ACFB0E_03350, partial [Leptolyngbyaceae cyanobacterium]